MQVQLYQAVVESKAVQSLLSVPAAVSTSVLPILTKLRKLCNSPALLYDMTSSDDIAGLQELFPADFVASRADVSGTIIPYACRSFDPHLCPSYAAQCFL